MTAVETVAPSQRFTRRDPCPICGGYADLPQGKSVRCAGYVSSDGQYAHCQREQYAAGLPLNKNTTPATFAHRLHGTCRCGVAHGLGAARKAGQQSQPGIRRIEYTIYDASGIKILGVHVRKEFPGRLGDNGKPEKKYSWERHNGRRARDMPPFDSHKLRTIPDGAQVVICEGEPATLACQQQALSAVGTYGAEVIPGDEHLLPLCRFNLVLWPDNDHKGHEHMRRIAERLQALGAKSVRYIIWPDAPEKGDAADYFASGGTVEGLKVLIHASDAHTHTDEHLKEDDHLRDWDGGTLLSDVTATCIEWLWGGYIPLGKITVGDGDPGLGKTMLYAADLAARVTNGDAMPDGSPGVPGGAGVIIFTAEDDPADTLQPRFVAAGGDLSKVMVVTTIQRPDPDTGELMDRLPSFNDLAFIERKIMRVKAKLVIFDPFIAFLPSTINSFRDQDVRSALAPLSRLAQKSGAAFVLIRHLNKGNFGNALYRGGGSIGIIGAARSGLLVVKDPDDENVRIFGSTKSNLGKPMPSWKYRIAETEAGSPVIHWEGQSERSASDLLNAAGDRDTTSKLEAACDLLRNVLKDGAHTEEHLKDQAKAQGISLATLRRAKKVLGVESEKVGVGKMGYWLWTLLDKGDQDDPKDTHIFEDDHLSDNTGHNASQQADSSEGDHGNGYEHLKNNDHLSKENGGDEWKL